MRILFTGASSFTGERMAAELARDGHQVTAVFTRAGEADYDGVRRQRINRLLPAVNPAWQTRFGDDAFLRLCRDQGPWDLLCHHAADVTDYKSASFDWQRALAANTHRLAESLSAFKQGGGRAVVLTGTYFEADEGIGAEPREAFSPYGLSKTLTWQAFRFECGRSDLRLGKYVLPNPIGPGEEPRFVAYLVNCWKRGESGVVQTPDYVRDNLPVPLLATDYRDFVEAVGRATAGPFLRRNPSGWVEPVGTFALRVATNFAARSSWNCRVECLAGKPHPEPKVRHNVESCLSGWSKPEEDAFWSAWVESYTRPVTP
jgi:UDP-glucose 4-epimerase